MAKRRRLKGEEARRRILDAAEVQLSEGGPQGLKLTKLAKGLGVSHQAILHHFESRDGLLTAVLQRALEGLQSELTGGLMVLDDHERGSGVLINRAFEVLVDQRYGRLLAWLALGNPDGEGAEEERRDLQLLTRMAHAVRERDAGGPVDERDTTFMMILLSYAVLGASVFERGVFTAAGLDDDPGAKTEFRDWLRAMVVRHLESAG